ncbi:MAG TPA: hypothetical protein IGS53_21215 [Leptolyngbyaceae cyanobacterium M33_DOE_097]|uniref:DUF2029 domain-containing protein n=1 Tax=Oscillatoriales cyanobacterium SpSt-418 TaxID=2282169 RepID=A0A7C3PFS4_9CYAN|nr:hypothetical protein [Leptolyngbyaceae cyanobacterium M33_DOE_097]
MRKSVALAAIGFAIAFSLCAILTLLGIDKFYYVQAGGEKFATFPDALAQWGVGLSYLALHGIYFYWLFFQLHASRDPSFQLCLRRGAGFLLLAFLAYPLGNDIYVYLHSGLINLAGENPYLTPADAFVSPLSPLVDWGQTSTYGPFSQLLFAGSALTLAGHAIAAVYVFKLFCLGLHVLNSFLVWQLLAKDHREQWTMAYLLNPLLLMEQVGSAHIDILVNTSFLVLAGLLFARWYALVWLPLCFGFLSKTLPLIWVPLVFIFLVKQRRWWQLVACVGLMVLLFVDLSLTSLPTLTAWKSLFNPGVTGQYRASLHEIVRFGVDTAQALFPAAISPVQERIYLGIVSQVLTAAYVLFYAGFALRAYLRKTYDQTQLLEDLGWVTLALLLFATAWVMPWYSSSLLAISVMIPERRLFGLTCLVYSVTSSAQYALQELDGLNSLIAIGLPLLVIVFHNVHWNWRSPQMSGFHSGLLLPYRKNEV